MYEVLLLFLGSTFMAASGMNLTIRNGNTHKYAHIHELTDFALDLQRSVYEFNQSLIEFDLVLRHASSNSKKYISMLRLLFQFQGRNQLW